MNGYTLTALWLIGCSALIWVLALHERIRMMRLERDFAIGDAAAYEADAHNWRAKARELHQRSADLEVSVALLDAELERRAGRGGAA